MKNILKNRNENSHKGTYGRIGILGGSTGMSGAIYLASESALRTGSGLVYTLAPKSLENILGIKLTEAILQPLDDMGKGYLISSLKEEILKITKNLDVIGLGPGMGYNKETIELVYYIVRNADIPLVIDADGLNCISNDIAVLRQKSSPIILTPHPKEMERLINVSVKTIQENRVHYSKLLAKEYDVFVVLKGHETVVASPNGEIYINRTGNPGMATAGSGDVLTGIIVSLLGQGISLYDSAKLGVYLHGLSGDLAAEDKGEYGIIARDIIENIPYSIKKLLD